MDIYVNSKDKVGYINQQGLPSAGRSNMHTFRSIFGSSADDSFTRCSSTRMDDTIHYLSPASTTARTEVEGDMDYQQFFMRDVVTPPDYRSLITTSSISCDEMEMQRTIAIIKPEAMDYKDVVLRAVNEKGFKILHERTVHLTPEQVSEIYAKYYGGACFPHMVVTMSISPVYVMSLAANNAVDKWKSMIGPYGTLREEWFFPYSVRTRFGHLMDMSQTLHASENMREAEQETRYFFPRDILEPIPVENMKVQDYMALFITPTLTAGLAEIVKTKPVDPLISLAEWLLLHNPFQPRMPKEVALTPT